MEISQEKTMQVIGELTLKLKVLEEQNARLRAEAQDRSAQLTLLQNQLTERINAENGKSA